MKTQLVNPALPLVLSLCFWTAFPTGARAQDKKFLPVAYLETLPKDLALTEKEPQTYLMTADYFNKDLFGRFFSKTRVSGEYTRGLEGGFVAWHKVAIAESSQEEGEFPAGKSQDYMENFRYIPSEKMVGAEAFAGFPPNSIFAQNLVWDAMGFEVFAWEFFDSLRLNEPFRAREVEIKVPLAGQGTFENKNATVTWLGLSRMNGEPCALIHFQVMDNPLEIQNEQMKIKGRSHYWGHIWVSLEDKQIEHATLSEDVVMDLTFAGQSAGQYFNTTREIAFKKWNGRKKGQ